MTSCLEMVCARCLPEGGEGGGDASGLKRLACKVSLVSNSPHAHSMHGSREPLTAFTQSDVNVCMNEGRGSPSSDKPCTVAVLWDNEKISQAAENRIFVLGTSESTPLMPVGNQGTLSAFRSLLSEP